MNEIDGEKEYIERFQLVPVGEQIFTQAAYEQHGNRIRSAHGSPATGELNLSNQPTVYIQAQHPSNANENVNGLRFSAAPAGEVRYEDEGYATNRYEYVHAQHQQPPNAHHNIHHGANEEIKVELIRGQALHGKVCTGTNSERKVSLDLNFISNICLGPSIDSHRRGPSAIAGTVRAKVPIH